MKSSAWFETDSEELIHIWNGGLDLYDRVSQNFDDVYGEAFSYSEFLISTLYLTADATFLKKSVDDLLCDVDDKKCKKHIEDYLTLPLAIEEYINYTNNIESLYIWIDALTHVWRNIRESVQPDALQYALYVGGAIVIQRLCAKCNLPLERIALSNLILDFHARYYCSEKAIYHDSQGDSSPELSCVIAALGFLTDDAQESVRKNLIDRGFEIKRTLLPAFFRALVNLEVGNIFLSCVLEHGAPRETDGATALALLNVLICTLIGVDISMLGRGIQCADGVLPENISYCLTLPYKQRYMTYEGGEHNFEIGYTPYC